MNDMASAGSLRYGPTILSRVGAVARVVAFALAVLSIAATFLLVTGLLDVR